MSVMYVKIFVIMFSLGGASGIVLGNNVLDVSLHDSYYVVSHFHMVLSIGSIISIIVVMSNNQESMLCHIYSITSQIMSYQMYVFIVGVVITFVPQHYI